MKKWLAKLIFFRIWGWSIVGDFPKGVKKAMIVVAPHTSNTDFFLGIFSRTIQKYPANFLIKKEWLDKPIVGSLIRSLGGVGVDRSKNMRLTDQLVQQFAERDEFVMTIAPEGTRKYNPNWKSGFWYIAKQANILLVPASFDYPTKRVIWGEPFFPSESKEDDFAKLREFFRQYTGKNPDQGVD